MSDNGLLAERAAHFHELVLQVACGPGGLLLDFPCFDTRRPLQEGELQHPFLVGNLERVWGDATPRPALTDWLYGENNLWATGWFLWSQILRYRATQQPEALETARKCFRDLNHVFRLSAGIEPGLLGKPHGGRPGATTSYDQSASPVLFYATYAQELATDEEKSLAIENLRLHGDYYLRRDWVMNHHGHLHRIVDPAHTSVMKYLACVHAAYELTGEERFREAVVKYLRQIIDGGMLPWPVHPYEINHNLYYYSLLCDYWIRTSMADEADWIGCIKEYWHAAQASFDADGLPLFGHYDGRERRYTAFPEGEVSEAEAKLHSGAIPLENGNWYVSSSNQPNRPLLLASTAALALLARSHGLDDGADEAARHILMRMDEETLRWCWDDGSFPMELQPLMNMFATEVAGMWLVAYWMGRQQNVW